VPTSGKRFFFVLHGRFIVWYTDNVFQKGAYLHDYTVSGDVGPRRERFDISVLNASAFFMEADNEAEKIQWLKALDNVSKTPKITVFNLQGRETTTFSDWLFKSGGKTNAGFKKRWCVVKGNIFYYYEHPQDPAPKGFWDLKDCELGRIKERDGASKYRWKVTLKEDTATTTTKKKKNVYFM